MLLERNKHLEKYYNKNISYIIFQEGNIPKDHQEYIQNNTSLPLQFINVSGSFTDKTFDVYPPTKKWRLGYRNMCNFWFCEFWKYLENYNKILRIDEDCNLFSDYNTIFQHLTDKVAIYGNWFPDDNFVTKNLNKSTINFIKQYNIEKYDTTNWKERLAHQAYSRRPSGPYTNVIGLNLDILRKNTILTKYISYIKNSNNIYIYRWGDLPLWGEALSYFFSGRHARDNNIQYFHKSHNQAINM